eukprot:GHVT01048880.1.p1 GENE.GHVT01048880.1~~GHVT01048880.1.p1  ORF type:complete len:263 (-),score=53.69 GHVT01048880.1:1121-1909(-)
MNTLGKDAAAPSDIAATAEASRVARSVWQSRVDASIAQSELRSYEEEVRERRKAANLEVRATDTFLREESERLERERKEKMEADDLLLAQALGGGVEVLDPEPSEKRDSIAAAAVPDDLTLPVAEYANEDEALARKLQREEADAELARKVQQEFSLHDQVADGGANVDATSSSQVDHDLIVALGIQEQDETSKQEQEDEELARYLQSQSNASTDNCHPVQASAPQTNSPPNNEPPVSSSSNKPPSGKKSVFSKIFGSSDKPR